MKKTYSSRSIRSEKSAGEQIDGDGRFVRKLRQNVFRKVRGIVKINRQPLKAFPCEIVVMFLHSSDHTKVITNDFICRAHIRALRSRESRQF